MVRANPFSFLLFHAPVLHLNLISMISGGFVVSRRCRRCHRVDSWGARITTQLGRVFIQRGYTVDVDGRISDLPSFRQRRGAYYCYQGDIMKTLHRCSLPLPRPIEALRSTESLSRNGARNCGLMKILDAAVAQGYLFRFDHLGRGAGASGGLFQAVLPTFSFPNPIPRMKQQQEHRNRISPISQWHRRAKPGMLRSERGKQKVAFNHVLTSFQVFML